MSVGGARVRLDGFEVTGSALTGLHYDADSVLRARRGRVTRNAVGMFAGAGSETVEEWFDEVQLFDNDVDFPVSELQLPPVPKLLEL